VISQAFAYQQQPEPPGAISNQFLLSSDGSFRADLELTKHYRFVAML
jgi:hypothetical protein